MSKATKRLLQFGAKATHVEQEAHAVLVVQPILVFGQLVVDLAKDPVRQGVSNFHKPED